MISSDVCFIWNNQRKGVITLGKQIQQFATVQSNLTAAIGSEETEKLLSKSLFFISTGSNDILGHVLSIGSLNKEEFIKSLSDAYDNHLKARFFLLSILMITVHNIVLPKQAHLWNST